MESLKKELSATPESLNQQMKSLGELNESLTEYLKRYCEEARKLVEGEVEKVKEEMAVVVEDKKKM